MSHFPIRPAYGFAAENGLTKEVAEIQAIPPVRGFGYMTGVRRWHMIELLKSHGLLSQFIEKHWPEGNSRSGIAKMDLYNRRKAAYESLSEVTEPAEEEDESESEFDGESSSAGAFAYERDLQNYIANNLHLIESGLHLYSDERGRGIEYPVEGGRIDILAQAANNTLVVIELKLSRGRSKAVGQLLYYMGWVDENLRNPRPCRGILLAKEIGPELVTTVRRTKGIELFKYSLQVSLKRVEDANSTKDGPLI